MSSNLHQTDSKPSTRSSIPLNDSSNQTFHQPNGNHGGSSLLLRFFQSDFFNVHLAIAYLKTYSDSIGITYYLINRLNEFSPDQIDFYWPQLCHLLISKPTESFALENFIIKKSQKSTHLAIKTLWYLQASLSDLSSNPSSTSFSICHRTFNRIQSIIFSDPILQSSDQPLLSHHSNFKSNHSNLSINQTNHHHPSKYPPKNYLKQFQKLTRDQLTKLKGGKISEKVLPTTVGLGILMASIGLPSLNHQSGHVPIDQARHYHQSIIISSGDKIKKASNENDDSTSEGETYHSNLNRPSSKSSLDHQSNHFNRARSNSTAYRNSQNSQFPISNTPFQSKSTHFNSNPSLNPPRHLSSSLSTRHLSPSIKSTPDYTPGVPLTNHSLSHLNSSFDPSSSTRNWSLEWSYDSISSLTILTAPPSLSTHHSNSISTSTSTTHPPTSPVLASLPIHTPSGLSLSSTITSSSPYNLQFSKSTLVSDSSSRPRPSTAITQSAPSLPDTLFRSKQLHSASLLGRNGHAQNREIPLEVLNQVLKSQSMRTQLELITSLQDISTRLIVVPKKARLSALRAELTVLNHSLPKGCCLGMYCNGDCCEGVDLESNSWIDQVSPNSQKQFSSVISPNTKPTKPHHRVVRISPNESVVLNSADRVPFLIHVEILEDHLDFDPNRRSNHEDLRKALKDSALFSNNNSFITSNLSSLTESFSNPNEEAQDQTHTQHGLSQLKYEPNHIKKLPSHTDTESFSALGLASGSSHTNGVKTTEFINAHSTTTVINESIIISPGSRQFTESPKGFESTNTSSVCSQSTSDKAILSSELVSTLPVRIDEEMDLVDQIYGQDSNSGCNSQRLSDEQELSGYSDQSLYLPSGFQNKALDEQVWERAGESRKGSLKPLQNGNQTAIFQEPKADGILESTKPFNHSNNSDHQSNLPKIDQLNLDSVNKSSQNLLRPTTIKLSSHDRKTMTLDEYAERMRMAAIMLAQLNESQQPSQTLTMTSSSAAGMVVGGAIGLGAGFVGVTVGAGLGAVVSRRLATQSVPVITSPIGRQHRLGNNSTSRSAQEINAQVTSIPTTKLDEQNLTSSEPKSVDLETSKASSTSSGLLPMSRHKVLTPQQSQSIKDKIMAEMMALEQERMERMELDNFNHKRGGHSSLSNLHQQEGPNKFTTKNKNEADEAVVMKVVNEEDPSGKMLGESWIAKKNRIRASSPYGHLPNWNLVSLIVKTGADLRQEELITQLIKEFGSIWKEEECDVWVRYYRIMVTGESTGLMETIVDAVSIHSLKKSAYSKISKDRGQNLPNYTVYDYYVETFGKPESSEFKKAQDCFMRSLVAYSIISYILQIKDRHNGNILIDKEGHVIHIDFGFVLSNSPGSLGFEMAPFKLNQDYLEVLGGLNSSRLGPSASNRNKWNEFVSLFKLAFKKLRKHAERIITIVELMQIESKLPCFSQGESTIKNLRERFQLALTSDQVDEFVERLILSSASSVFTKLYDSFQYYSQGVL
ncbi:hypothetical protein O181_024392 [Austropuccinia psidii MF-1]|uniref:1-phosphatidylinositol 4-kinase n=1 Tax=Austropuccinia psidii MF-1 TaxID=1389203 RepID=A0A9Q3GYY2_9BASI|nr:hypothetical protein [Austropuccinia psidii MF-1]